MSDATADREPKFRVEKAVDENNLKAIHLREQVSEDPDLTDGAKLLFIRLLDLALNPNIYGYGKPHNRGQVIISMTQLSERLHRSERAIGIWVAALVMKTFIWVSKVPRPNTHPMNCYHITAFQPLRQAQEAIPGDGLWGNGYRRPAEVLGEMQRRPTGKFCGKRSLLFGPRGEPISSYLLEKAAANGTKRPREGEDSTVANGVQFHRERQNLPFTGEPVRGSERHNFPVATAKSAVEPGTKQQSLTESQQERSLISESESPSLSVQRVNAFEASNGKAKNRIAAGTAFLQEVREVMDLWKPGFGKTELENSGGWWRKCFNQKPDRIRAVLADIRAGIREGREFSINPGAAAVDLYKRFTE